MTSLIDNNAFSGAGGGEGKPQEASLIQEWWNVVKTRTNLRLVLVGVIVVAVAALVIWNLQISLEQNSLDDEVADLQAATNIVLPDPDALNAEISAALDDLKNTQDSFVVGVSDAQLSLLLIDLGNQHEVVVNFADLEPESFEQVEGKTFPAKPVSLSVDGELTDLIAFVGQLEAGVIEGFEIQSVDISAHTETEFKSLINGAVYRQLVDSDLEEEEEEEEEEAVE